jgi:aminoglycoside phosphotransferase (APT) family kinase protein
MGTIPEHRWARLVARVEPGGRFAGAGTFPGGLSSDMTVLEVDTAGGARLRLVVRRLTDRPSARVRSVAREYRLIARLHSLGLPVPPPVALDESGEILDRPYAVYRYVDGALRLITDDPRATGREYAAHLARIHEIEPAAVADLGLAPGAGGIVDHLARPSDRPDASVREATVHRALARHLPDLAAGPARLLHGDLWPGNVLFDGSGVAAVIDWECACLGDPLADVAITRLDLWWGYGRAAATAFTDRYVELTAADVSRLAVWELVAALRPAGNVSSWAADWSRQGRPDITPALLRAVHRQYLDAALAALGRG